MKVGPSDVGTTWIVSGIVLAPKHSGQSTLTVTATATDSTGAKLGTGSVTGAKPGAYRIVVRGTSKPVRSLKVDVTLAENGTVVDDVGESGSALSNLFPVSTLQTVYPIPSGGGTQTTGGGTYAGTTWDADASDYEGKVGQRYTYSCPAHGTISDSIWGTSIYTDDTSVCTAAVQAGLITVAAGGTVTIEIRAGANSYTGSSAHGVASGDYGAWDGSFVFVTGR